MSVLQLQGSRSRFRDFRVADRWSITGDTPARQPSNPETQNYLLTWNVKHLANPNKLHHLQGICAWLGQGGTG